jgi:hypothetical protein
MYNVEEAYMKSICAETDSFKKLRAYIDKQITKAVSKGELTIQIDLEESDYNDRDINRIVDFLKYLGFNVLVSILTNGVTRLHIYWGYEQVQAYKESHLTVTRY